MPTSNIDDILATQNVAVQQEPTPEPEQEPESHYGDDILEKSESTYDEDEYNNNQEESEHEDEPEGNEEHVSRETDDYGNEKEKLSKKMQDRLKKQAENMKRQHEQEIAALQAQIAAQNVNPIVKQATKDFEYDSDSDVPWQQQLEQFVEQTIYKMSEKSAAQQQKMMEQKDQNEFRDRFNKGMDRFDDFIEVVAHQPVTETMTYALRGINDPAAFIYAVSKRNPQELERISKLHPAAQMVEIGRLEERMRAKPSGTKAPKPLSRTQEDSSYREPPKKQKETIEDLIRQSENRKLAKIKSRSRR